MDKETFKSLIEKRGFSTIEKDGKIIVNSIDKYSNLYLDTLESIPDNIIFNNDGFISLDVIKEIPEGVIFRNYGGVYISSVLKFSKGVRFENYLESGKYKEEFTIQTSDNIEKTRTGDIQFRLILNCMIKQIYG